MSKNAEINAALQHADGKNEHCGTARPTQAAARLPYPILRFMDGRQRLMDVDASTWGTVAKGDDLSLVLEDGTSLGAWIVDRVHHQITARRTTTPDGKDCLIPLALLRVTVVELFRVKEER